MLVVYLGQALSPVHTSWLSPFTDECRTDNHLLKYASQVKVSLPVERQIMNMAIWCDIL